MEKGDDVLFNLRKKIRMFIRKTNLVADDRCCIRASYVIRFIDTAKTVRSGDPELLEHIV